MKIEEWPKSITCLLHHLVPDTKYAIYDTHIMHVIHII